MFMFAAFFSRLSPQAVVNPPPFARALKLAKIVVNTLPFRIIGGQISPLATRRQKIKNRLDNSS
jgi:hypothetical protein